MNIPSVIARAEPATRGRGRPKVDDKRQIILDAATRMFAERGYHGTAMPEVAEAAAVGIGTLYRYFADKNALVNSVYREAKLRLKTALYPTGPLFPVDKPTFARLWHRLVTFARTDPHGFRFLEMQDHADYLDAESRQLESSVLAPLVQLTPRRGTARTRRHNPAEMPIDLTIALIWGAFVGMMKAHRLGYLALDDQRLKAAGDRCWLLLSATQRRSKG